MEVDKEVETMESSFDGSLDSSSFSSTVREFLVITEQSVPSPKQSRQPPSEKAEDAESLVNPLDSDRAYLLNPVASNGFQKIGYYLRVNGFDVPDPVISSHLLESLSEEADLSQWFDRVLQTIIDQNQRIQKLQKHVLNMTEKDPSHRLQQEHQAEALEKKLKESKKKEEQLQRKLSDLELSSLNSSSGSVSRPSGDSRLLQAKLRSLESLLKESERKQRQKETDFERLRSKLHDLVEKERREQLRESQLLKKLEGKERLLASLFSSAGFLDKEEAKERKQAMAEIAQLFVSLEKQRKELAARNEELERQVSRVSLRGSRPPQPCPAPSEAEAKLSELQEVVIQQKMELDYQEKRLRLVSLEREEEGQKLLGLQQQLLQQQQTIDNLQIELKARPTVRQWQQTQREIADLEKIAHNAAAAREEAEELVSWRKHLSSAEQMKIDQRNHELQLWLVDSLPRSYLKETLQQVCRELDLSDPSEIVLRLQKLKTVVRTVPRMEELLSNLSAYVFERNGQLNEILGHQSSNDDNRRELSLDSLLSILRRWWMIIQRCIELEDFRLEVLYELFRREELLFSPAAPLARNEEVLREKWRDESRGLRLWLQKEQKEVGARLRDLVDFETQAVLPKLASEDFHNYLKQRPDLLSNRTLSYLQSLFELSSVEDLLPSLHQLFLRQERFLQFLDIARRLLGRSSKSEEESILREIVEKLQKAL